MSKYILPGTNQSGRVSLNVEEQKPVY